MSNQNAYGYYTFYIEREAGIPAEDLSPEIILVKQIPDGANFTEVQLNFLNNRIRNLGEGLYSFYIDWSPIGLGGDVAELDFYENIPNVKRSLFVKIDTKLTSLDLKYLTMRIEREDVLASLVDNIHEVANEIKTSSESITTSAERILALEEGSWIVEDNHLYIYRKDEESRVEANAIAKFSLFDQTGTPTSDNPYSRIATEDS